MESLIVVLMEDQQYTFFDPTSSFDKDLGIDRGDRVATSFFSEISYHFKRILSKINKFYLIWIQEFFFLFLLLQWNLY